MLQDGEHKDYEHVLGAILMERYDDADIQRYLRLGIARRFRLPRGVADDAVVVAINEENKDRVDITWWDNLAGVPIKLHILIDISDRTPYCWAFTLNLTKAEDEKVLVDVEKIKEIAKEVIPSALITIENFPHYSDRGNFPHFPHSSQADDCDKLEDALNYYKECTNPQLTWNNNDLLMINILNALPRSVLKFVWGIAREAIATTDTVKPKYYGKLWKEIDDILKRNPF